MKTATPTLFAPWQMDGLAVLPGLDERPADEYPALDVATATLAEQEQAADLRRADVCRMCWADLADLCRQYHAPSGSAVAMRAEILQREGIEQ